MKSTSIFTLLGIFLLILTNGCMNRDASPEETKILWLGSSSTYMHEMPLQMEEWLNKYSKPDRFRSFLVGRSGTGFHVYLRDDFEPQYGLEEGQSLIQKIDTGDYDLVVLQMITYFLNGPDSLEIMEATRKICEKVREKGGEPVFFEMGWANDSVNYIGREMVRELARKHEIKYYAPCSEAWARVRNERSDIELFNLPDSDHPGTLGNYLNMCCLYKSITGDIPRPLPLKIRSWPRFGSFDKDVARQKLDTTGISEFHRNHPEFIKLMSVMQTESEITEETALYLAKVADSMDYGK
jgi:hypothetical protein